MAGDEEQDEEQQEEEQDEQREEHQVDDERVGARGGSSPGQRRRWRQRALWLTQLGLAPGDDVPVEAVEEVADAVVTLLGEVEHLEATLRLERATAPRSRRWPRG